MDNNKFRDLSVFEAIKNVCEGEIIIPDIQREYCWSPQDIAEMFKSIIQDYPIGSFIFWKVRGDYLNSCSSDFYAFLTEVWRKRNGSFFKLENRLLDKNFENNKFYNVVLDGQQRLSSFYLVFKGEYNFKKTGRGHDDKESNYEKKELYYVYNWDLDIEDANRDGPFAFLTCDEADSEEHYRIKDMLRYEDEEEFYTAIDELTNNNSNKTSIRKHLKNLFKRLNNKSQNESLIHCYTINSNEFDEALDVFVRVNSTGIKLDKTDLLFGTLINKWSKNKSSSDGRRKEIEKYLKETNEKYNFNFSKDFLLRTCIVLSKDGKSGVSMQEIANKDVINSIRDNWDKIKNSIKKCSKFLKDIDLNDDRIVSYNAIIPIIYYFYKGGKSKNKSKIRDELRKYFAISFAKGLFGGSSDTAITNTCKSIKENISKNEDFNISYFSNTEFSGGRNFHIDIKIINKRIETYNKGTKTYFLLMLLSPGLNLLEDNYDQDHSHAANLFNNDKLTEIGISNERIDLWNIKKGHLPNLSFMQESRNRSKNKTDLETWLNNNPDKKSSIKLLPLTSYKFKDFETFYILRRSMIKFKLCEIFGVNNEQINVGDCVTINRTNNNDDLQVGMHGLVKMINDLECDIEIEINNNKKQFKVPLEYLYIIEDFDKKLDID